MLKGSVAQLVEWQIRDLKGVGSSSPWCFCRCRCRIRRIRSGLNSRQLSRTQRQAERRAAWPGTACDVTARYGMAARAPPPPASLPPRWRNMRSLLLWPISFCIFGMCSPWRKSAATVWTVCMRQKKVFNILQNFTFKIFQYLLFYLDTIIPKS